MSTHDEGGPRGMGVDIPVSLQWSDVEQAWLGRIYVDQLMPGRCGWAFAALAARVSKGQAVSAANQFLLYKPTFVVSEPVIVPDYEADHRIGPTWRCKTRPPYYDRKVPDLFCAGNKTYSERRMIDADTTQVTFSIFDDDVAL